MGIYFDKLMRESAVVQDPDNVGVDLDAVEDAIVNNDGHDDLQDPAYEDGLVGDPVDEAFMIMYESSYNYSQLMQCIGMVELREAASGRDFVLMEADIKGFFTKIKEILVKMFESITKAFKNVWNKMVTACTSDKKLATSYAAEIKAGSVVDDWSFEGYTFPNPITYECKSIALSLPMECRSTLKTLKLPTGSNEHMDAESVSAIVDNFVNNMKTNVIERNTGLKNCEDISEMKEKLQLHYYGSKSKITFGKGGAKYPYSADEVIATLKDEKETDAIKKGYNEIKKGYNDALKAIKEIEKTVTSGEYGALQGKAFTVCEAYTNCAVFEKNVQNTVYSITMAAAKAKRAQARKVALMWQRLAHSKGLDGKKTEVQHNSTSMFSNLGLI